MDTDNQEYEIQAELYIQTEEEIIANDLARQAILEEQEKEIQKAEAKISAIEKLAQLGLTIEEAKAVIGIG